MPLDLALDPSSPLTLLGYHGTTHGGGEGSSSPWLLIVVLGLAATAGWLVFSELRWRNTVLTAAGAWIVGLGMLFAL